MSIIPISDKNLKIIVPTRFNSLHNMVYVFFLLLSKIKGDMPVLIIIKPFSILPSTILITLDLSDQKSIFEIILSSWLSLLVITSCERIMKLQFTCSSWLKQSLDSRV